MDMLIAFLKLVLVLESLWVALEVMYRRLPELAARAAEAHPNMQLSVMMTVICGGVLTGLSGWGAVLWFAAFI